MVDENKPAFKIFPKALQNIKDGICPTCGEEITEFNDKLSEREYQISGMCQKCQDKVFNKEEE